MIIRSAYEGNQLFVKQCLKEGVPVDFRDPLTGDTALMAAALAGQGATAKFLVKECNASVACVNNMGKSALHYAVANEDVDLCVFLVKAGCDPLGKDNTGNVPLFLTKSRKLEQEMRKAEKKCKEKLKPVPPPGREGEGAKSPRPEPSGDPTAGGTLRKTSMQTAASLLVRPVDEDAKQAMKGVAWNTLRGTTDAVDVVYVYVAGAGSKALPVPIKKTTSADDVINYCCQKLLLTEFQRYLMLKVFAADQTSIDVPGFKHVLIVKTSYPNHRFVLYPVKGSSKDVGERLESLAQE